MQSTTILLSLANFGQIDKAPLLWAQARPTSFGDVSRMSIIRCWRKCFQTLDLLKFRHGVPTVGECDINSDNCQSAVDNTWRWRWTRGWCCRQSTDNGHLLITLSVERHCVVWKGAMGEWVWCSSSRGSVGVIFHVLQTWVNKDACVMLTALNQSHLAAYIRWR